MDKLEDVAVELDKSIKNKVTVKQSSVEKLIIYRGSWVSKWIDVIYKVLLSVEWIGGVILLVTVYLDLISSDSKARYMLFDESDFCTVTIVFLAMQVLIMIVYTAVRIRPLWGIGNILKYGSEAKWCTFIILVMGTVQCIISSGALGIALGYTYCMSKLRLSLFVMYCAIYIVVVGILALILLGSVWLIRKLLSIKCPALKLICYASDVKDAALDNGYVNARDGIKIILNGDNGTLDVDLEQCGFYVLGKDKIVIDYTYPVILSRADYKCIQIEKKSSSSSSSIKINYEYTNGSMRKQ